MKRRSSSYIASHPVCFLVLLMLVVLSPAGLLIPLWFKRVIRIEKELKSISQNTNQELLSGIQESTATFFSPINASTINLVRLLSSSLDGNDLHFFSKIESKVAPTLFQALSTIPHASQSSYIGLDGLFFAYFSKGGQAYALYSNSTFSSTENNYTWFIQPANRDTGKLFGEAIKFPPFALVNSSWFQEALNSAAGYASIGKYGFGNNRDFMLLSTVAINGIGCVSLAFSMKPLIDFLTADMALYNGHLYLQTMDGNALTQGIPNTSITLAGNQVSIQLLLGHDEHKAAGSITCDGMLRDSVFSIWDRNYDINCSPIEITGLKLVYVLALPQNELSSLIHKNIRLAFVLLIIIIGIMVVTVSILLYLIYLIYEAENREMHLRRALINQMEATQQSERKSMNKSLAFASASHDIRASLAGISGLIDICRDEISKRDPIRLNMQANLLQMEACTKDLLGILNSILDTSKIEAGKMQLEEEQLDVEQLLEDVVDLYHPVGMKKGVDVILDPYDGSVLKSSSVCGDRGKLKQILGNLLSNGIKFTSEGHVVVRAWARKPSPKNEILASNRNNNSTMRCFFNCLMFNEEAYSDTADTDPNCMEFLFEVNDTGKGIPKEKQKSVFENYVQVKETAIGQEGTGLGLGIVQSLVRLMGGEIGIVDKEVGERGTCFRFNVFLNVPANSTRSGADIEANNGDYISSIDSFRHNLIRIHSPKPESKSSRVVLFIQSTKRSYILRDFMNRKLGLKVHVVKQIDHLSTTLQKIKLDLNLSGHSSSGKSSVNYNYNNLRSDSNASARSKEVPLSSLDGAEGNFSSSRRKRSNGPGGGTLGLVLVVIDTHAGPLREISRAVAEFRRDLNEKCCSRVVWLDKPDHASFMGLDADKLPPSDLVISKPFHGSRLYQTIGLLPEFDGVLPRRGVVHSDTVEEVQVRSSTGRKCEIEEVGGENSKKQQPLIGKKILVVDDDPIGRKVASFVTSQLGAKIVSCENGEQAWKQFCASLNSGDPFDFILMDCEMPVMKGSESIARIREAEGSYGRIRVPIMALTAHKKGEEELEKMIQAGADGFLTKPVNKENLLHAISQLVTKNR